LRRITNPSSQLSGSASKLAVKRVCNSHY
jgi:hypothetical protein